MAPTTKKRKLDGAGVPDDDDRKRGRPRVEKSDESAADRRRTQIRLAQRAYRQRKESTLEDLRGRVSQLTNTLERANKLFEDFSARLTSSGLNGLQTNLLQHTAAQLKALVHTVRSPERQEEPAPAQSKSTSPEPVVVAQPEPTLTDNAVANVLNTHAWLDQSTLSHKPRTVVAWGGWTIDTSDSDQDVFSTAITQHATARMEKSKSELQIPRELPPVRTYSFNETTFGRRLHRACLEAGYRALLDPNRLKVDWERVFRLSLLDTGRHKLIECFKTILERGANEPLELYDGPRIRVGGAGLHYPRLDALGRLQAPQTQQYNLGLIGPQMLELLGTTAKGELNADLSVEIPGYEGIWFDPYDVEGYLTERLGVRIDPTASFVEADIVVPTPAESLTTDSSPATLADLPDPFASIHYDNPDVNEIWTETAFVDANLNDPLPRDWLAGGGKPQILGASGIDNPETQRAAYGGGNVTELMQEALITALDGQKTFRPAYGSSTTPISLVEAPKPRRKKRVVIDISLLVKNLNKGTVCLGRTPGYRPNDVDRALEMSTINF